MSKATEKAIQGASFLTITSLLAKILAAFYRIPYQNYVGDVGFYIYQQVYPIYGLAMMLALGGFPMFVSKVVAESHTKKEERAKLNVLFLQISGICLLLFLLFFAGKHLIATLMGDAQLAPLIGVTSFTFLMVPFTSMIRGGFQGHLIMQPTGFSQVIEQFARVSIIWFAAYQFIKYGVDVYLTGKLALSGSIFGGILSMFVLFYAFYKRGELENFFWVEQEERVPIKKFSLFKRLLLEGGGLSLYSGLLILYQFVDSFTVKNALVAYGLSSPQAQVTKGIYDRSQPIVQLGLVVSLAFSTSFLPVLAKNSHDKRGNAFAQAKKLYTKLSLSLAIAATAGLIFLLPLMNFVLFNDRKLDTTIELFLLVIFFMSLAQTLQSVYQSEKETIFPILAALLSLVGKMCLTYPLTALLGTIGASLATVFSAGMVFTMLVWKKKLAVPGTFYGKNILATLAMSVPLLFIRITSLDMNSRILGFLYCLLGIALGAFLFLIVLMKTKAFTVEEFHQIIQKRTKEKKR